MNVLDMLFCHQQRDKQPVRYLAVRQLRFAKAQHLYRVLNGSSKAEFVECDEATAMEM